MEKFQPAAGVSRPRNVIVIVLESVGTHYLSLYESTYETTPCLAAEAKNALVFDNFYSHLGYTFCSSIAINYSIHPGLPWFYVPNEGSRPLPPTLASALRAQGWRTAYIHNGDLDWDGMRTVVEGHGFDVVQDKRDLPCPPLTSWGTEDRCALDRVIEWIDEDPAKPFFTLCWTDQTHDPYSLSPGMTEKDFFNGQPPAARAGELSRYLNILHETDRHLGRLFAALRERGLADDTLVVVTGDHGEAFTDPHDQRGHGFTLYEEDVNVPLMLWNPRLFPAGQRVPTIGSHMDINATIADILGVAAPAESQGRSLFDPGRSPRAYFVASIADLFIGVREGSWKYILDASTGRELLFDLSREPAEERNLAPVEPAKTRELGQRVSAFAAFENTFLRAPKR
jgi:arylsulfatase A-like enzyme